MISYLVTFNWYKFVTKIIYCMKDKSKGKWFNELIIKMNIRINECMDEGTDFGGFRGADKGLEIPISNPLDPRKKLESTVLMLGQ